MTESAGKYDRRNFVLNLAEGILWIAGSSLIASQTVLPALILRLGGGNIAVGTFNVVFWVGLLLPQLFAARFTQTIEWKKPWAIRFGTVHRSIILLIGVVLLTTGGSYPYQTMLFFFIFFGLNQLVMGIATPGWFDMYAKMTHIKHRGRLTGIRTGFAGAASFGCGFVLTWLLNAFGFPLNYGFAFLLAALLQFGSLTTQTLLVEESPSKVMPLVPLRVFFAQLLHIIRVNHPFRNFVVACTILTLATISVGFMTVYAFHTFHADEHLVGRFTIVMVFGQMTGGILNGWIADHKGNKLAFVVASSSLLAASIFALAAPSLEWFYLVFFLLGGNLGTELMTRYNLAIEYGPVEQRSTYIGLMNTIMAPFYFVGVLGGWIANTFGYQAVFMTGIVCSLIGISLLILVVKEPRGAKK